MAAAAAGGLVPQADLLAAWAGVDPEGLAAHARTSWRDDLRAAGLTAAGRSLLKRDPLAAASLARELGAAGDFEELICGYLESTDSLSRTTAQALGLAEAMEEGPCRRRALSHVVREWHETDPDGALQYLSHAQDFDWSERRRLAYALEPAGTLE
jgi:hypothetical protein